MTTDDDLRAAVAAGILTEDQAARIVVLADSRRGAREDITPGDEPFELFRGFNEIFIVVGLGILGTGWVSFLSAMALGEVTDIVRFTAWASLATAVLIWGLSEYFIRMRRMVAPAIVLTLGWAANAVVGAMALASQPFMIGQGDLSSLPLPLGLATVAVLIHWMRFRVPVSLAIAVIGVLAALVASAVQKGEAPETMRDVLMLTGNGLIPWIVLGVGLGTFVIAMAFDMSDPHRVTRRASNGFWLHILAAPAIVNTVALTLLGDSTRSVGLALFLLLVAVVAIVIDRRSFLIAGAGYAVAMAIGLSNDGAPVVILAFGAALVLIGAKWEPLRRRLLHGLGPILPLDRLPPG